MEALYGVRGLGQGPVPPHTSLVPRLAFRSQSDHDIYLLGAVLGRAQPVRLIFGPDFILFLYYVKSQADAGIREGTTALKHLELNVYLEMGKFVFQHLMVRDLFKL